VEMNRFAGQTVIVLGGSSGIGLAVAQGAAAQDARVILLSRSLSKLQAASKTIPGGARTIALDMLDEAAIDRAVATIETIDHLVLTAIDREYALFGELEAITSGQVERSFDKLRGFIHLTRAAKPKLGERASITMLSGAGAVKPPKGSALAAAANASIVGFTRALAAELAPVRVNCLMPGPVETPLHGDNLEQVRAWALSLPAQHFGRPDDIAQAALLLMTNPYITGHTLTIDGGYLLQ
jgi:NAD(P)-dependent dehydrogenase (short-subunit alcohol dehydrogenase family)